MPVQTITTPGGEELVVLTRSEYEDLLDARQHAAAMEAVARGSMPTIADPDMDAYLAARSPLAFWRERRGLTPPALAQAAGVPELLLAQMESGDCVGDIPTLQRLARHLDVRLDDIAPDERGG